MTDTTDKERDLKVAVDSLKHNCLRLTKYQHRATVDIEDVELVLTALEAERQRADEEFILIGYAEDGKGFVYEPRHQDRISNPIAIYRRKES